VTVVVFPRTGGSPVSAVWKVTEGEGRSQGEDGSGDTGAPVGETSPQEKPAM